MVKKNTDKKPLWSLLNVPYLHGVKCNSSLAYDLMIVICADPSSETRSAIFYVPRDEAFSDVKQANFTTKTLTSVISAAIPAAATVLVDINLGFPTFSSIDQIFDSGYTLPQPSRGGLLSVPLIRQIASITQQAQDALKFDLPDMVQSNISLSNSSTDRT